MPGIDRLIAYYLSHEIKNQLPANILKKIERDLFFNYGMSIKLSIEHFDHLSDLLENFPQIDHTNFKKNTIKKIIDIKKLNENYLITIKNSGLQNKIFDYYGDPESREILSIFMGQNLTIPEVLAQTKIQKSPAYRKIDNMILDGLIIESGKVFSKNKHISKYKCIFKKIKISIEKQLLEIESITSKKDVEQSSVFRNKV